MVFRANYLFFVFTYNEVFLEHLCKYYWNNLQKMVLPVVKLRHVQNSPILVAAYHYDSYNFLYCFMAIAK